MWPKYCRYGVKHYPVNQSSPSNKETNFKTYSKGLHYEKLYVMLRIKHKRIYIYPNHRTLPLFQVCEKCTFLSHTGHCTNLTKNGSILIKIYMHIASNDICRDIYTCHSRVEKINIYLKCIDNEGGSSLQSTVTSKMLDM